MAINPLDFPHESATEEVRARIGVLRRTAIRSREEATTHREEADRLDEKADHANAIADQYQQLLKD